MLSGPTVVNVEITDVCNVKCRHCYNFWREENDQTNHLEKEQFDKLVQSLVDAEVFHVVLSGGEPFAKFEMLEYGFKQLQENNISVSCNTNLMLATDERIKRLMNVGVDHVLTSLTSHDPATNDFMVHQEGAYQKIIDGIKIATKNGMRVSVNMVVGPKNLEHVYQTGKLAHELGCQKIFGTRMVPSVSQPSVSEEYKLDLEEQKFVLDELVRLKEDTGIMIGTLVSYPLCFLGDLDRYRDFVGRGCPAQSGHVMGINANGETHACVHESEGYGNVYEMGIKEAYKNMRPWHDKSYYYEGCKGCDYIDICETGCSMFAEGYLGTKKEADPCYKGPDAFLKPYKLVHDPKIYDMIDEGLEFSAPERLRFRKEDGFYLVNIRWANSITIPNDVANFLIRYQKTGKKFNIFDFGIEKRELLANLFFKDVLESKVQYDDTKQLAGLGVNVE
jgi:radical SAM protein with 4Fe4S-binding SPASM domain